MIRECGRLDIKNPYEDLTSNEGFSFTKVAVDTMVTSAAAAGSDVQMNDESQNVDEERKGTSSMIDTSGRANQ